MCVGGGGDVGAVQCVCVYSEYLYCRFLHGSMCVLEGEGGGSSLPSCLPANVCLELCERWKRLKTAE